MIRALIGGLCGLLLSGAQAEIISLRSSALTASFDSSTGRITELSLTSHPGRILSPPGIELRTAQQVQVRFITGSWLAPTDPSFSETPWRILQRGENGVTAESSVSPLLKLRSRLTIEIDRTKPRLRIRSTLTRTAPNPFPVQAWLIVPAPTPDFFLLDTTPEWRGTRLEWIELSNPGSLDRSTVRVMPDAIRFTPPRNPPHPKVGTLGRWVAGVYPDKVVVLVTRPTKDGYADGSSVQAYAAPTHIELETVSPNRHLKPSQRLVSESTLWVFPRDPSIPRDKLPAWINTQLGLSR